MLSWLKDLFKHQHKWRWVRVTCPYPEGLARYCKGCGTLIDFTSEEDYRALFDDRLSHAVPGKCPHCGAKAFRHGNEPDSNAFCTACGWFPIWLQNSKEKKHA